LTGIVGDFIEEDSSDQWPLGCVGVYVSLDSGNSSGPIRGVNVTNHLDASILQPVHIVDVGAVWCGGWAAVGIDDCNDFDSAGS
jgi:hypothetical protein